MFGTYRTILALFVVASHLGGIPGFAGYAVFGFYILSGYLMTFILQVNYGYSWSGVLKYAANRFLRIFPLYWVATLISITLVIALGSAYTSQYSESIFLPKNIISALQNFFIVLRHTSEPRLIPSAWAL